MSGVLRLARREPAAAVSVLLIVLMAFAAIAAPLLTPYVAEGLGDPNISAKFSPPSAEHPLGADHLGRDLQARLLFGARTTLGIACGAVIIAAIIGAVLGVLAGFFGGWVDEVISHLTNVFLAVPQLLLAIALASALGASGFNAMLAIALTWWPWYARLVRSQARSIRGREFIAAAEALGASDGRMIIRHVVPNSLTPLLVQATSDIGAAILASAALSFLGLGVQPPTADWGQMVSVGRIYFPEQWWYAFFPGAAIFVVALCFSLIGDGLQTLLSRRDY